MQQGDGDFVAFHNSEMQQNLRPPVAKSPAPHVTFYVFARFITSIYPIMLYYGIISIMIIEVLPMRKAREKSSTGIYHVVARGLDRQVIFHHDNDYNRYLTLLSKKSKEIGVSLLGYCLMDNHVHLLVNEETGNISDFMRSMGVSYAWWFNRRYDRSGYLFQNRFHSESVENEPYLLAVLRYIHLNPVKAEIVQCPENYRWSSCSAYYSNNGSDFLRTDFILNLFSDNPLMAKVQFKVFMNEASGDQCLDVKRKPRKTDAEVYNEIVKLLGDQPLTLLNQLSKAERNAILKELKTIEGSSVRQIARITNIGISTISRA
ncbi:MAG: transposase [Syntrophomonas sp.]